MVFGWLVVEERSFLSSEEVWRGKMKGHGSNEEISLCQKSIKYFDSKSLLIMLQNKATATNA